MCILFMSGCIDLFHLIIAHDFLSTMTWELGAKLHNVTSTSRILCFVILTSWPMVILKGKLTQMYTYWYGSM